MRYFKFLPKAHISFAATDSFFFNKFCGDIYTKVPEYFIKFYIILLSNNYNIFIKN